jgi:hypothetical protein|tara:strand:- start:554 stop:1258 length:705 start_codon:yes stop_codon:yes gene_type:complete
MAIEFGGMNQDPSLARYRFYDIQKRREELEAESKKRTEDITSGVANLWKMWTSEQGVKASELLASDERLEMDPEYIKKSWLGRSFTPAGGRVRPRANVDPFAAEELQDIQGIEKFSEYFTDPLTYDKKKVGEIFTSGVEKAKIDAFNRGDAEGLAHLSETGVSTGAKVLGGIGAATGIYDLATNWEEYRRTPEGQTKALQRGLQTVGSALTATGVGAGIGVPLTLGATLWDWMT